MNTTNNSTVNDLEVEKFTKLAHEWWNYDGKFKTLHKFNPVRLELIIDDIKRNFKTTEDQNKPLSNISILDIGCGGGLMSEPLARLGAKVTGIDAVEKNVKSAQIHAEQNGLEINYLQSTVEELDNKNKFDVVLNLEVIEHVNNQELFVSKSCELINDNGLIFIATINKTLFSLVFAKYFAEYVLGFLPKGTHEWSKFLTPEDLYGYLIKNKFEVLQTKGINYNPIKDAWYKSSKLNANFIISAKKS